jgi:hypothetical protein
MPEPGWRSFGAVTTTLLPSWRDRSRGLSADFGIWACVAVLVLLVGRGSSDELHIWTDASGTHQTEAELERKYQSCCFAGN